MAGLEEIYTLIDNSELEIVDDFTADLLIIEYKSTHGSVTFDISVDYPDDQLKIDSKMNSLDNQYINQMLAVHAEYHQGQLGQMRSTLDELKRLLAELVEEQEAIEEGKRIKLERENAKKEDKVQSQRKKYQKQPYNKPIDQTPVPKKTKLKMKTVMDVVNRIQWDEKLSTSDFTVGYTDRFCGIQEKPYDDFTWNNIVDVDYYEDFGVPEHRVVYFKYLG